MRKREKPSPTASPLLFEFDPQPAEEILTSWGGIPLVVQAFRSLGLPGSVQQHVVVKERQRGYDAATFVESFVVLNAAGGSAWAILSACGRTPDSGNCWGTKCLPRKQHGSFCMRFMKKRRFSKPSSSACRSKLRLFPPRVKR